MKLVEVETIESKEEASPEVTKIYLEGARTPILVAGRVYDVARSLSYEGHKFVFFDTVDRSGQRNQDYVGVVSSRVISIKSVNSDTIPAD